MTRAEQQEQTREEVIAAADRLFVERGFHATSVDQIAQAAGYTKGAVYSNFASKEDLFFAVYERRAERAVAELERTLAAPRTRPAGSSRVIGRHAPPARARGRLAGDVLRVLGARHPPPGAARALRGASTRARSAPFVAALERLAPTTHGARLGVDASRSAGDDGDVARAVARAADPARGGRRRRSACAWHGLVLEDS